jgi:hypothetical protein
MITNCTFKLVYDGRYFEKVINLNLSPLNIKNNIKSNVLDCMQLEEFDIIIGRTPLKEKNNPINCDIITPLLSLIDTDDIANNNILLYIKPIVKNTIIYRESDLSLSQSDLLLSQSDLSLSQLDLELENTCPICYITIKPSENMTFGCQHSCCRRCVASWFHTNNTSCPLCRA